MNALVMRWIVLVVLVAAVGCWSQPATVSSTASPSAGLADVQESLPPFVPSTDPDIEELEDDEWWAPAAGRPPYSDRNYLDATERSLAERITDRDRGDVQDDRKHLTEISLNRPTDALLLDIAKLPTLRRLFVVGNPKIAPSSMKALGQLGTLEELEVHRMPATMEAISEWTGLHRLKRLTLQDDNLTDGAMSVIGQFKNLEHLDLSGNRLTDAAVDAIATLERLQSLVLRERMQRLRLGGGWTKSRPMQITDASLPKLSSLQHLAHLNLSGNPVTGVGLRHLAALPELNWLVLSGPTIRGDAMEALVQCHRLETLLVHNSQVNDAGLAHISRLVNLKSLALMSGPFTDQGVAELVRLGRLKELRFYGSDLTDESLKHISQLASLQELWIRSPNDETEPSPKFTATGFEHLLQLKDLRHLTLRDVDIDPAVPTLCQMTWLKTLFLDETKLSEKSLRQLWDSPLRQKTGGKAGLPNPNLPREPR